MEHPIQTYDFTQAKCLCVKALQEIPTPPTTLFLRGTAPTDNLNLLSIVGSRKYSTYGQTTISHLVGGLAGYNVGIVSGLALGIDGLAHTAALDNNLYTLAIPGSGLADNVLYPARHRRLATRILNAGGGLFSEYKADQRAAPWTFPQRNRLVVGISQATLVIEAAEKSGSLISARLAVDYNRELLVVPGSIFSPTSQGTHQFLKLGATPVTSAQDIIEILKLVPISHTKQTPDHTLTELERKILKHITEPVPTDYLIQNCHLPTTVIMTTLMELELKGVVTQTNGNYQHTDHNFSL